MNDSIKPETRTIYCEDALKWLETQSILEGCSIVASLPDISEFPAYSTTEWKDWFVKAAILILSKTDNQGVTIFYQSDIKHDGEWIDKGYLCQKAAEQAGHKLLWHKIACRVQAGQATFGRPGYSHILCFSKDASADISKSKADVMPEIGEKVWERGMGINACLMIASFISENTSTKTIVNPFCGQGSMLAAANALGLSAVGIERSPKRAALARNLSVILESRTWVK